MNLLRLVAKSFPSLALCLVASSCGGGGGGGGGAPSGTLTAADWTGTWKVVATVTTVTSASQQALVGSRDEIGVEITVANGNARIAGFADRLPIVDGRIEGYHGLDRSEWRLSLTNRNEFTGTRTIGDGNPNGENFVTTRWVASRLSAGVGTDDATMAGAMAGTWTVLQIVTQTDCADENVGDADAYDFVLTNPAGVAVEIYTGGELVLLGSVDNGVLEATESDVLLQNGITATAEFAIEPTSGNLLGTLLLVHGGTCVTTYALTGLRESGGAGGVVYRVNCGGDEVVDPAGVLDWGQDSEVSPSPYRLGAAQDFPLFVATFDASVPASTPAAVFGRLLFVLPADPDLQYEFPVAPGTYEVRLYFGESFFGDPDNDVGRRVFDVRIEEQLFLDDFDILAQVGPLTGVAETMVLQVVDGTLDIDFVRSVDSPVIAGIEIVRR